MHHTALLAHLKSDTDLHYQHESSPGGGGSHGSAGRAVPTPAEPNSGWLQAPEQPLHLVCLRGRARCCRASPCTRSKLTQRLLYAGFLFIFSLRDVANMLLIHFFFKSELRCLWISAVHRPQTHQQPCEERPCGCNASARCRDKPQAGRNVDSSGVCSGG